MAISTPIKREKLARTLTYISQEYSLGASELPMLEAISTLYLEEYPCMRSPTKMVETISCFIANLITVQRLNPDTYLGLYKNPRNASFYNREFTAFKWNLKVMNNLIALLEKESIIEGFVGHIMDGSVPSVYRLTMDQKSLETLAKAKVVVSSKAAQYVILRPKRKDEKSATTNLSEFPDRTKRQFTQHRKLSNNLHELMKKNSLMNEKGEELIPNYLCWVFTESFEKHGRMYFNLQNMPSADRRNLTINGERVVEIDYNNCSAHIMYAMNGLQLIGDAYPTSSKFTRKISKKCFTVMGNVSSGARAVEAVYRDMKLQVSSEMPNKDKKLAAMSNTYLRKSIRNAIEALEIQHDDIIGVEEYGLYQRNGLEVMAIDAKVAMQVVQYFVGVGEVVLPYHDSFIVRKSLTGELRDVMISAYKEVLGSEYTISITEEK
jgi:hypothetical protein